MVKEIILIGGGDYRKEENVKVDKYIVEQLDKNSRIIVLPFAIKEKERRINRFESIKKVFLKKGIKKIEMVEEDFFLKKDSKENISSSKVIFLTGGNPKLLLETIIKLDLRDLLKNFVGLIIGYSAGAMIFDSKCVIPGGIESDYPKTVILDHGIGLINNLVISPHYKKEDDSILIALSNKYLVCGVADKSALIYRNGKFSKIGHVVIFRKSKKYSFNSSFLKQ